MEDVGIDPVEDHREALAGGRADGTDNVGADVVSEIWHARSAAACAPAATRARIAFDAAFVAIPELDFWIVLQRAQFLKIGGALGLILALGPALRHAQVVVELVQVANRRAIAQFHGELLFEPAVDFHPGPVFLRRFGRVFEHGHE